MRTSGDFAGTLDAQIGVVGLKEGVGLGAVGPAKTCQWPMWGFHDRPSHVYCSAAVVPGRPYCADHCARAFHVVRLPGARANYGIGHRPDGPPSPVAIAPSTLVEQIPLEIAQDDSERQIFARVNAGQGYHEIGLALDLPSNRVAAIVWRARRAAAEGGELRPLPPTHGRGARAVQAATFEPLTLAQARDATDRKIVELAGEGLSHTEIGNRLGLTKGQVSGKINRMKDRRPGAGPAAAGEAGAGAASLAGTGSAAREGAA